MRFFHLSDLHIGIRLFNRDLAEDQQYVLGQIIREAEKEQPDAVVIAGDVYDRPVPSAEAVGMFDRFISALGTAAPGAEIMIISGNHDSPARLDLFRKILSREKLHMIGLPPLSPDEHIEKVTLRDAFGPVHFYLLPFVKPSAVRDIVGTAENGNLLTYDESLRRLLAREEIDISERNVLVSHQFYLPAGADPESVERMDSEILTVGNIDEVRTDVLAPFDYAALGHIHKPMKAGDSRFRYCGTPLSYSVSEAGQKKGIVLVEMGAKGEVGTKVLPLFPLRGIRVVRGTADEVLGEGTDDYVRVVLTDRTVTESADLQERLRYVFPNLLEVRRESGPERTVRTRGGVSGRIDVLGLISEFMGEMTDEERALLSETVNRAEEVGE